MGPLSIGYARCSTTRQDTTAQRKALRELGVDDDRIYLDEGLTGSNLNRPGLTTALAACRGGDRFVVPRLDRLGRSVTDLRQIGDSLAAAGIALQFGSNVYDPTDPIGKVFFMVLAVFAEFERDVIRQRTREGMDIARARGKLKGKQPTLSRTQEDHLSALHDAGEHTVGELATEFRVSRATVYRALERVRARELAAAGGAA